MSWLDARGSRTAAEATEKGDDGPGQGGPGGPRAGRRSRVKPPGVGAARNSSRSRTGGNYFTPRARREALVFLALALPNIVLIAFFTYRPLFANIYYSTLDWTLGAAEATAVGWGNYVEFFTSSDASTVLGITAIFTIATVGGAMFLGLLVGIALNAKVKGQGFARSAVFAPYVLSGVGVGLVCADLRVVSAGLQHLQPGRLFRGHFRRLVRCAAAADRAAAAVR